MKKFPNFVPKSGWFWGPTVLIILIIVALLLLPTLLRNELQSFLIAQGVKNVTYQAIDVDIFSREFRFEELRLQSPGSPGLYLRQARVRLSLIPLWDNTLKISKLTIQGSEINTKLNSDGTWDIGGLKFPLQTDMDQKTEQPQWDVRINKIELKDIKLNIGTPDLKGTVNIKNAVFENRYRIATEENPQGRHRIWHYKLNTHLNVSWITKNLAIQTHMKSSGSLPRLVNNKESTDLNAQAKFNGLVITSNKLKLNVLRAATINLDGIKVARNVTSIKEMVINDVKIGDPSTGEKALAPFARLEQTRIQALQWESNKRLHIDKIGLKSARVNAHILKSGKWKIATKLAQVMATETKAKAETKTKSKRRDQSLQLLIKTIELDSPAHINFEDHTVTPPVITNIIMNQSRLRLVDNSRPGNKSPINLTGQVGKYGHFDINGDLQLFAPQTTFNIQANINELGLPPLSPYAVPKTGYQITHGHLDMKANINAVNGQIKGTSKLTFKNLKTRPVDQAAIEKFTARLTMPLETIMLLLEDKNKIRLDVPISGSADDPRFSFADVLNKSVISALRSASLAYLMYYFQPYGALVTIIQLGEKVFKMRLDPIVFSAGGSTLDQKSRDYLKHVSRLMQDKKKLDLSICGRAVPADKVVDVDQANILARTRSENVRNYLVTELKIESRRLYVCQPEPDTGQDAQPRVELEF